MQRGEGRMKGGINLQHWRESKEKVGTSYSFRPTKLLEVVVMKESPDRVEYAPVRPHAMGFTRLSPPLFRAERVCHADKCVFTHSPSRRARLN